MNNSYDIVVVGAGAAGMMAAYSAAMYGAKVCILEHNEKCGKKIYITGKGRCNITNACDVEDLFNNIKRNNRFMYSAIYSFDNNAMMDFLKNKGLKMKIERGNRVFPESDHSSDVIRTLEKAIRDLGVDIAFNCDVKSIGAKDIISDDPKAPAKEVYEVSFDDNGKKKKISCKSVILATGGLAYPQTGSDGSGFKVAKELGHSTTAFRPCLVPFNTIEDYFPQMQGLSLRNINFRVFAGKKVLYEEFGELLFTHFGISGPVVISASSAIHDKYFNVGANEKKPVEQLTFEIDLKPALTEKQLDERIQRDFAENINKQFRNGLSKLLPGKMIPIIIELSGIDPDKKINEITKEERHQIVDIIKHLPGTVAGLRGYNEAIITRGGINVKEINPSTMESKIVKGLYMCGEMLDVDAYTGGFNLQIAWSTGYLAGMSSALALNDN